MITNPRNSFLYLFLSYIQNAKDKNESFSMCIYAKKLQVCFNNEQICFVFEPSGEKTKRGNMKNDFDLFEKVLRFSNRGGAI